MNTLGYWKSGSESPVFDLIGLQKAFHHINTPLYLVYQNGSVGVAVDGSASFGPDSSQNGLPIVGFVPACSPKSFGDRGFLSDYGLKYPLIGGSMAHGISSAAIVEELGKNGMMAFFGAAGLSPETVEKNIDRIAKTLGDKPFGFNLIHSPNEPKLEEAIVDLYLRKGIKLVEASAYLGMTLALVRYRVHGIHRDQQGKVVTPNRIIAKVSRVEVGTKFFSPPPEKLLQELVNRGTITPEQAEMAATIPMAYDLTAEADSGGHTDNRPAITLTPTMVALRDRLQKQFGYPQPLRVGAAGGISTPLSMAAAFAMGAAYVMTGSVNQSCIESGLSPAGRDMLALAQQADTAMAPAGDMFEMGVTVQVLKRGTMFAMRAAKLYELYKKHQSLEEISAQDRASLEKNMFLAPLETIWQQTKEFFQKRDPSEIDHADRDPKHRMALVFRWYLGQSPRWAVSGEPTRKMDYQIWSGPAMGAFNEWVKGSSLEPANNRKMLTVAHNLLYGAAVINRLNGAKTQGVSLPAELFALGPQEESTLQPFFA